MKQRVWKLLFCLACLSCGHGKVDESASLRSDGLSLPEGLINLTGAEMTRTAAEVKISGDFNGDGKTDFMKILNYKEAFPKQSCFKHPVTGAQQCSEIWIDTAVYAWFDPQHPQKVVDGDFCALKTITSRAYKKPSCKPSDRTGCGEQDVPQKIEVDAVEMTTCDPVNTKTYLYVYNKKKATFQNWLLSYVGM